MRNNESTLDKAVYWMIKDRIPVTKSLIVVNLLSLLLIALFRMAFLQTLLAFDTATFIRQPWTALTYPIVWSRPDVISILFAGYWLWIAGGSLERAWGSTRFAVVFFAISTITAIGLFVGTVAWDFLVPAHAVLPGAEGLWLPLAGVTVAFGMMNPEQVILFMFFLPLKLKYLALIDAAIVFFSYVYTPIIGVFALSGCAFAYWYVRVGSRLTSYRSAHQPKRGETVRLFSKTSRLSKLNPLSWYKERREQKKLKDFFNKSGFGE